MATLDEHVILGPSPAGLGVGAGAPPIPADDGLLLFYHERGADQVYTARACLLDSATGRVRAITQQLVLTPELSWERKGDVDNVVFVQGAHRLDDGRIYLTYGVADRAVGAAFINEADLIASMLPVDEGGSL
ncbi:MAG: hypothetical protein WD274_06820 [Acidimicrobiia bacterium]